MTVRIKRGAAKREQRRDWDALREKFASQRASSGVTLAEFAKQEGLPLTTVEEQSRKKGWLALAEKRAQERHQAVEQHSADVLAQLRKKVNFDESEVRARQSTALRALLMLGVRKLKQISEDPKGHETLSIDQMIEILRYIPAQERAALGLPEKVMEVEVNNKAVAKLLRDFRTRVGDRQKVALLAADLMQAIEGEVVSKTTEPAE